jgi:hypothetical protein
MKKHICENLLDPCHQRSLTCMLALLVPQGEEGSLRYPKTLATKIVALPQDIRLISVSSLSAHRADSTKRIPPHDLSAVVSLLRRRKCTIYYLQLTINNCLSLSNCLLRPA